MIRILAIGNSFSEDAMAYLHPMAAADGVELECVNLYIGGCSLERHCENIDKNTPEYTRQVNGKDAAENVTIKETLLEEWDFITIQQASHDSGIMETYEPYAEKLYSYIRTCQKDTPVWIHETWAYETDSSHEGFARYHNSQKEMYEALKLAYGKIGKKLSLPLIPAGTVIQELRKLPYFDYENGGRSLCKDGYHMELLYGRYAAAAVWYHTLLSADLSENTFVPCIDKSKADKTVLKKIRQTVMCAD